VVGFSFSTLSLFILLIYIHFDFIIFLFFKRVWLATQSKQTRLFSNYLNIAGGTPISIILLIYFFSVFCSRDIHLNSWNFIGVYGLFISAFFILLW